MAELDAIWREYEGFERENVRTNSMTQDAALAKARDRHANAKRCYRERKQLWDKVDRGMLARPMPKGADEYGESGADPEAAAQLVAWRKLLDWEKGNVQKLEDGRLAQRLLFTYNLCLVNFRHYAHIWYEAAAVCVDGARMDAARLVMKRGCEALPMSELLAFVYADFEEMRGNAKEANEIYRTLLRFRPKSPLVFVQQMRFARRVIGPQAAQKVFSNARKAGADTYHVYLCMSAIELHINGEADRAREVMELGFKKPENAVEPAFIQAYISFLKSVNDESNLRLLFERVLRVASTEGSRTAAVAKETWNSFMSFEYTFGTNLKTTAALETRRADSLHLDNQRSRLASMLCRYHYRDLWPCTAPQVRAILTQASIHSHAQSAIASKEIAIEADRERGVREAERRASQCPRPDMSKMKLYQPEGRLPGTGNNLPVWPHQLPDVRQKYKQLPRLLQQFINKINLEYPPQHFKGTTLDVASFLSLNIIPMSTECPARLANMPGVKELHLQGMVGVLGADGPDAGPAAADATRGVKRGLPQHGAERKAQAPRTSASDNKSNFLEQKPVNDVYRKRMA